MIEEKKLSNDQMANELKWNKSYIIVKRYKDFVMSSWNVIDVDYNFYHSDTIKNKYCIWNFKKPLTKT